MRIPLLGRFMPQNMNVPQWLSAFDSSARKSKAGVRVSPETALYSMAVASCIGIRSASFSTVPVHVYRDTGSGKEKATEHPVYQLLKTAPSSDKTSVQFRRWLRQTADLYGDAYVYVERHGSRVYALHPIHGDTEPIVTERGGVKKVEGYKHREKDGTWTPYRTDQILHFPSEFVSEDGITGRSLVEIAREAVGLDIAAEEFMARVLANGTHMGTVLVTDSRLGEKQQQALKDMLEDGRGIAPAGKVRVFQDGVKPQTLGMSVKDADLTEQRRYNLERICGVFRVPLSMVQDLTHGTYTNTEQADIALAKHCITPLAADAEQIFTARLLTASPKLYVKFDLNGLMRGDFKTRMEGYSLGVNAGILAPDEPRAWEDLNPKDGGDELRFPVNSIPASKADGYFDRREPGDIEPFEDDARARIRDRYERDGDTERSREFARTVTAPLAKAHAVRGDDFDMEAFVKEALR